MSPQCKLLSTVRPLDVSPRGSPGYVLFQAQWWSQVQADASPRCVFRPRDGADVSGAVLVARVARCPFAVKSGGHAAFRGASNADEGITVDMRNFKDVVPSQDKESVVLGTGNLWIDVYNALEKVGIGVIGGRDPRVGVGEFTLGGIGL